MHIPPLSPIAGHILSATDLLLLYQTLSSMHPILGVGTLLFALGAAYGPQCRYLPGDV